MLTRHQWVSFWRLLLLLEMLLVLYLSLSPRPPQSLDLGWDKLNHLAAFSSMALSAGLGFKRPWSQVFFALLAFGGLIEMLQSFVPNRYAQWGDLAADALGIVLGLVLLMALRPWLQSHHSNLM